MIRASCSLRSASDALIDQWRKGPATRSGGTLWKLISQRCRVGPFESWQVAQWLANSRAICLLRTCNGLCSGLPRLLLQSVVSFSIATQAAQVCDEVVTALATDSAEEVSYDAIKEA